MRCFFSDFSAWHLTASLEKERGEKRQIFFKRFSKSGMGKNVLWCSWDLCVLYVYTAVMRAPPVFLLCCDLWENMLSFSFFYEFVHKHLFNLKFPSFLLFFRCKSSINASCIGISLSLQLVGGGGWWRPHHHSYRRPPMRFFSLIFSSFWIKTKKHFLFLHRGKLFFSQPVLIRWPWCSSLYHSLPSCCCVWPLLPRSATRIILYSHSYHGWFFGIIELFYF